MVTIQIPKENPHGVLAFVPAGFSSSQEAIEHLRTAIDKDYGQAGRTFIRRLVDAAAKDEAALRRRIERLMTRFLKKLGKAARGESARVAKTFAIAYAAAFLARKWGVLPKAWGPLLPAILQVYRSVVGLQETTSPPAAVDRIRAYVKRHRAKFVRVRDIEEPYDRKDLERAIGFLRRSGGGEEVLFPTKQFQRKFPDHRQLLKDLRAEGRARTERGKQAKLSIKAPKEICATGRVYCIKLPS